MNDRTHHIHVQIIAWKHWTMLLLCLTVVALGYSNASAGLLEGVLEPVTEKLADKVSKKGETLTTGNFYAPETPDAHAPFGMMGDHTHNKGEMMWTYRFMQMVMDGNKNGLNGVSNSEVIDPGGFNFLVVPRDMTTQMHMFSGMYGVNNTLTVMVGAPYVVKWMHHTTRMGTRFRTRAEGWGDLKLTSLLRLYAVEAPSIGSHAFHLNFGLSVPTGSITKKDGTPLGNTRLPYPMQIGSGTVDLLPGLTYRGASGNTSWGFQAGGTVRTGRNSAGYRKGHEYTLTGFGAYRWAKWISTSLRTNWKYWGNIEGSDDNIRQRNPMGVPIVQTAIPNLQGGQRLDILGGVNILLPEWMGLENRFAVEAGAPMYQYLNGPQLETDYVVFAGYQGVY